MVEEFSCNPEPERSAGEVAEVIAASAGNAIARLVAGCPIDNGADATALGNAITGGFADAGNCECTNANTVIQFTAQASFEYGIKFAEDMAADMASDPAAMEAAIVEGILPQFSSAVSDTKVFAEEYCTLVVVADQSAETCIVLSAGNETEVSRQAGARSTGFPFQCCIHPALWTSMCMHGTCYACHLMIAKSGMLDCPNSA